MITAAVPTTCLYARYAFRSHPQRPQYCAHRFPIGPCCAGVPRAKRHQAPAYRAIPRAQRNRAPAYRADLAEASWVQAVKLYIASALCALALCFPDVGYAEPLFTKKPAFTTDYATAVRKREGKTKSNLPSAREAEALLEINEELFTTEALEGMSR